ncbi:class I SAM-dependent methyltransferase [Streptomyces pseudovenezuelae]|uniref:class I SAM-dependent methyltransferase n=1 Tax=Streptomyces pseudovenezuelae TaxID=67350 RepID=UPI00371EECBD
MGVTQDVAEADHTAVRVALWRALHVRADPPPHVLEDEIGLGRLAEAGFDPGRPAVVASTGVTMYLTREANAATFRLVAGLAPGSTLVTTFLRPPQDVEPDQRPQLEAAVKGAKAAGTPFLSFFGPAEILALARASGFREARHVPVEELDRRYFRGRTDGVRPSRGEELMLAST